MSNQFTSPLDFFLQGLENILEVQPITLSFEGNKCSTKRPWDDAHPRIKTPFQARLPDRVYKKMKWVQQHTAGGQSLQNILLTALERYVDGRIAEIEEELKLSKSPQEKAGRPSAENTD
jgi:hypothetical protein